MESSPPPPTHGKFSGFSEQRHKCREHHGNFAQPSSLRAQQRCNICKWRRVQNLKDNMDDTGGAGSAASHGNAEKQVVSMAACTFGVELNKWVTGPGHAGCIIYWLMKALNAS